MAPALPPERATAGPKGLARYEILRPIGRGGMGVVYEALDRERQRLVALKTLRHSTPAALYLFKREFRALVDVHHPNLVQLYELVIAESDRAFFTMELVRGRDFVSHVQRRSQDLRPALRQLVEGIRALHGAGKLHRDIEPSNVRVTPEGRVVLLDFGIATELAPADGDGASEPGETAGTARYMAPEQPGGAAPTAASDWYSVGVMLDEVFAGTLPADLDALRRDLLRHDPGERPDGAEIARRVGEPHLDGPLGPSRAIEPEAKAPFVGREASRQALRNAFDHVARGASLTVHVAGAPGMGKSTLVRRFLDDDVGSRALVLRGRAYERESVPYKALDSVVDALSRHLMRLDDCAALPPLSADAPALVRLFPVLRRVPALRDLAAPSLDEPRSTRLRAFAALREILQSLAERQPVVVFVDDVHWGDSDSAALSVELMRPPDAPPILFIAAYRDEEAERSPFLIESGARWPAAAEVRSVPVGPLDCCDARQFALALLQSGDEAAAEAIARESGGSPFLVEELARCAPAVDGSPVKLEQVVGRRLAELSADARRMLEVVAVGGRPLPLSVVAEASGIQGSLGDAIAAARAHSFVRTGLRDGHEVVETSHGRIRDSIVARMSEATVRDHHRRLAQALSAQEADSEAIALHYLGAGDAARGARHAARAAEQAASKLAFARSASLCRLALENLPAGSPERGHLYVRLGEVLEWAGRGAEAARAYLQAAERTDTAASRVRLERAAAEQLLASGRIDEGAEVLRRVLIASGTKIAAQFPRRDRPAALLSRPPDHRRPGLRETRRGALSGRPPDDRRAPLLRHGLHHRRRGRRDVHAGAPPDAGPAQGQHLRRDARREHRADARRESGRPGGQARARARAHHRVHRGADRRRGGARVRPRGPGHRDALSRPLGRGARGPRRRLRERRRPARELAVERECLCDVRALLSRRPAGPCSAAGARPAGRRRCEAISTPK